MKELDVNATKAHHESLHIMKMNAIYITKTEICGYLLASGVNLEGRNLLLHEACGERQSSDLTEISEIILPLYKNYLAGSDTKTNKNDRVKLIVKK